MLVLLPGGNWMDHSMICSISAFDRCRTSDGELVPPRVVVTTFNQYVDILPCESMEDAQQIRDQFVATCQALGR